MKKAPWVLIFCCLVFALLAPEPMLAQAEAPVSVDMGIGVAGPGEEASVPVKLSMPDRQVSGITFDVSFSKKLVSFRSVVKAPAGQAADLEIKTDLQAGEEEDTLRVELLSSSAIPQGELVELKFEVSKEAKPNDEVTLQNRTQAARNAGGQPLPARGADGLITIVGDAIFSCFFYMH